MAEPQDDQNVAPDVTQVDQAGASDTPGTPGPQQSPTTTAAQFPFPGGAGAPVSAPQSQPNPDQPDAQKAPQQASQPQQPASPASDPAVAKASKVHSILQALSGGPHYATTIDPNTGVSKETQVPMSNAQYARSLAAAVLTGAFSGLGEKGPGAEGKAAEAGFNAALKQQQDQQAQDKLQATQTYARQAAIAHTNFQQHETAQRMGQLDYEFHKQHVADNSQTIENVKAVGADLASNVHERDLLPKFNITQAGALIDGVEPRLNEDGSQAKDQYGQPLWDNTYTVVDPNKKIQLDQDTANYAAAHRIPGTFQTVDGKVVPKDFSGSPAVRAGIVLSIKAQTAAIQTTEAQLNQQLSRLGDAGKTIEGKLDANITQAIDKNLISPKSLQTFSKYASMPFDQALDQMRKDKVDPSTIGQISQLIPQAAQDALKKSRLDQEAGDKAKRDASAAVTKQQAELPGQLALKAQEARIETAAAGPRAYASESARIAAKQKAGEDSTAVKDMVKNPKITDIPDLPEQPVNGVNQNYLQALSAADPNMAAVVKAIGEGRQLQSKYGLAKEDGQRLAAIVNRAYPEYSQPKAEAYEKLLHSFTSGDDKKQIESGNTTYRHIADFADSSGKPEANIPGSATRVQLGKDASQLVEEVNSAYTKGVLHEDQRSNLLDGLNSVLPYRRTAAIQELTKLLSAKTSEKLGTFRRGKVTAATPDFEVVSPDAKQAYQTIMGNKADPNFGTSQTQNPGASNASQPARAPLPGQRPNEIQVTDSNGQIIGFTLPGKTGYRPIQK